MRLDGDARTLAGVSAAGTTLMHSAMLSASADMLVFGAATVPYGNRLEAVDRNGQRLRLWEEPEGQNWPRWSPDGQLLARQRVHPLRNTPDVWVEVLRAHRLDASGLLVNVIEGPRRDVGWCQPKQKAWRGHFSPRHFSNATRACPTTVAGSLMSPMNRADPRFRFAPSRFRRNGSWSQARAGITPCGAVTAQNCSSSIPTVSCEPCRSTGTETDGRASACRDRSTFLRSAVATGERPYDVSPDGTRVYLLRRNDDPAPREVNVVIGRRALLGS